MDEHEARQVLLVRAIENTDARRGILTDDDRAHASHSALALAQWDASASKTALTPALFLQKRAGLILKRIEARAPAFGAFTRRKGTLASVANALPAIALLAGVLVDRISDPHRVDLLSAPLLGIIAWNWVVYSMLLFGLAASVFKPVDAGRTWTARLMRLKAPMPGNLPEPLAAAVAVFTTDWLAASAPLIRARLHRAMHLSAAAFALGAVVSLYARGLLSQYQAGWESTFLDPMQVHAALSLLFMPAMSIVQLPGFSIAEVQALRLPQSGNATAGAQWVHLYVATLVLWAILPRLVLAAVAGWQENRLSRDFPVDLKQPYFRQLVPMTGSDLPAVLRVFPYSFTLDEVRDKGLATVAMQLLGKKARVMLRPSTGYGQESGGTVGSPATDSAGITQTVVLFNLNATPEPENHGVFLEQFLKQGIPGPVGSARSGNTGFSVLIDESAYLERMGGLGAATDRVQHRVRLWREFCAHYKVEARLVNLVNPQARRDGMEAGRAEPALTS